MVWDSSKAPSPKDSMHHELLMHLDRSDIEITERKSHPHFEFAAWLKLKNTEQLPSLFLMELTDRKGKYWEILDSVTIRTQEDNILLSGSSEPDINYLQEINIYLCHPSPFISCEIEELRFNNKRIDIDFLEHFNVA